jgi:hypothetical protein
MMAFSAMDDDEYERLSDVDVDIDKDEDEDEDRRSSSSSFEEYANILARDNDDTVDAMPPSLAAAKRGGGLRCDESGSKMGGRVRIVLVGAVPIASVWLRLGSLTSDWSARRPCRVIHTK